MYGKVFESMYEGTLYGQWEAIVTMQQFIVIASADGVVDMTPMAIAAKTSIPRDILDKGIEILSSPDQYSRTPGNDGVRIQLIDDHRPWGWYIVNHDKYSKMVKGEDKRAADRERIANKRKSLKDKASRKVSQSVASVADVAQEDKDVAENEEQNKSPLPSVEGSARQKKKVATRIPESFQLTDERRLVAEDEKLPAERTFSKFFDYWVAASGARARKHDWDATWRNWCRNESDRFGGGKSSPSRKPTYSEQLRADMEEKGMIDATNK